MPVSPGGAAPVSSVFGRTGAVVLQSADVTGALGYTPVNAAASDPFTGYALLAGRSGGQVLYGGVAASENLDLNSTAHATKGQVRIGAQTFIVDGATGKLKTGKSTSVSAYAFEFESQAGEQYLMRYLINGTETFLFDNVQVKTQPKVSIAGPNGILQFNTTSAWGGINAFWKFLGNSDPTYRLSLVDDNGFGCLETYVRGTNAGRTVSATNNAAVIPMQIQGATSQTATLLQLLGKSSTAAIREMVDVDAVWATSTDASRKARGLLYAWDTARREAARWESDGANPLIGFLGASAVSRQAVSGSRGANAALASLLTALANLGLITDGSS